MSTTITLRPGDIYRWSYVEPGDDRDWGRYHCCSRIAIVQPNGQLRDTYWGTGSEGRSFRTDDLPRLHLSLLANLSELDKSKEYLGDYYDDADIVNLNHANSSTGNFYLRKGAKRSKAKMLETARRKIEDARSLIRGASRTIEETEAAIVRIEAGETEVYI